MDIILVSRGGGRTWRICWDPRNLLTWLPLVAVALALGTAGYALGSRFSSAGAVATPAVAGGLPSSLLQSWNAQFDAQRGEIEKARSLATANADALARKLAQLQADMMRLDAAGNRMVQIANIDSKEFDFSRPAPMGGPEMPDAQPTAIMGGTLAMLDAMQKRLDDRQREMSVLEDILRTSRLQKEIKPAGWPITDGYISSGFGYRTDPFTGLRSFHPGIDIAGPRGGDVHAVAAGIVTKAGPDAGYGNLVEISHGNGYVTRYGHNRKILVRVGERVYRGQAIALEGSSGRSTGPHCHFEVRLDGKPVNPERYLEAAR